MAVFVWDFEASYGAEPYIGHFLWNYSHGEDEIYWITQALFLFMAMGLLRIARLGLDQSYRAIYLQGVDEMLEIQGFEGVKGILFDCYKTLIDIKTDEDSLDTYRPVCNWLIYQGVKISPDELKSEYHGACSLEIDSGPEPFQEVRVEKIFSQICKRHALWNIDEIEVGIETARAFRAGSLRRFKAYPKSVRLLKLLQGYPLAMVSNGQRVFSEQELRHLDLDKYFQFVIFSSDLGYRKPDPRIFLEAAKRLGLQPAELMYIGDNFENDIIPSVKLGMKAMHIEEAWRFFGALEVRPAYM